MARPELRGSRQGPFRPGESTRCPGFRRISRLRRLLAAKGSLRQVTGTGLPALTVLAVLAGAPPLPAQEGPPIGRVAAESLTFRPLEFTPPEPEQREVEGVPVLFLRDSSLPLVNVFARFKGGFGLFPRELYAAFTAVPALLRSGGTVTLPPDSVDYLLDFHAAQTSFGSGGGSSSASVNALRSNLDAVLELWTDMLRNPRFDSTEVEVWRGQELESVLRRKDDPGRLAFSEFNRLMFGDHPIGWEMEPADLEPEDVSPSTLRRAYDLVFCRDNLIVGVAGDVTWREAEPRLRKMLEGWPACAGELPDEPLPRIRREPGVFLIPKELSQTTVVMAHPGGVRQGNTPDYFASRIANSVLGGGGFSSRLLNRVRTEKGYAYSASSLWTTPVETEGIVGAVTQTKAESTIAAVRTILETMEEMTRTPPTTDEVDTAIESIVNGFGFNFQSTGQIVSREMFYLAEDLPGDWLEIFLRGVQRVGPQDVLDVMRRHLRPADMTILLLGDPTRFDLPPETLGPVTLWEVEGVTGGR